MIVARATIIFKNAFYMCNTLRNLLHRFPHCSLVDHCILEPCSRSHSVKYKIEFFCCSWKLQTNCSSSSSVFTCGFVSFSSSKNSLNYNVNFTNFVGEDWRWRPKLECNKVAAGNIVKNAMMMVTSQILQFTWIFVKSSWIISNAVSVRTNCHALNKVTDFFFCCHQITFLLYCTEVVYILWNLRQDMDHWQTEKKTKEFKKGGFSTIMMGILNYNHRTFTTLKRLKTKKRQKKVMV